MFGASLILAFNILKLSHGYTIVHFIISFLKHTQDFTCTFCMYDLFHNLKSEKGERKLKLIKQNAKKQENFQCSLKTLINNQSSGKMDQKRNREGTDIPNKTEDKTSHTVECLFFF